MQHQRPLVLANTDEAPDFRQILKTARMGSALFGPMFWRGQMLGQVITAAQARHTYGPIDLDIFMCFAHVAAAVYMAHGGPEWLQARDDQRDEAGQAPLEVPERDAELTAPRQRLIGPGDQDLATSRLITSMPEGITAATVVELRTTLHLITVSFASCRAVIASAGPRVLDITWECAQ